jgi:hypothetical protein
MTSTEWLVEHLAEVPVQVIPCYEPSVPRTDGGESFYQETLYGSILPAVWNFQLALRTPLVRLGRSVNRSSTSGKPKEGSSSEDRHRPRRKWSCTRFRRGLPRRMKSGTSLERCGHSDK